MGLSDRLGDVLRTGPQRAGSTAAGDAGHRSAVFHRAGRRRIADCSTFGAIVVLPSARIALRKRGDAMNVIGPTVRRIRKSQGMTQEALATRCHVLNWTISRGTLAKIESQVRRVTDEEAVLLARALNVDVGRLFGCMYPWCPYDQPVSR